MRLRRVGSLVVVERGDPVGIITERDLVRRIVADELNPRTATVDQAKSIPLITIGENASLREAARLMQDNFIKRLVVVADGELT